MMWCARGFRGYFRNILFFIVVLSRISPSTSENAITYTCLRNDCRILHIRCSAENFHLPPRSQVTMIAISNCTSKDRSPIKLAWASDEKPRREPHASNMFLASGVTAESRPVYLDILMSEYDPSVDQRVCCTVGYVNGGEQSEDTLNTTITKAASHGDDECSGYKTGVIVLATVLALLLLISLLITILICLRHNRRVKTYKKTLPRNENESSATSWNNIHSQGPIYHQESTYSISNLHKSQNSLYKTKIQQGSLQRSSFRPNGRCSSRPSLPPPIPPPLPPPVPPPNALKKDATLRSMSSVISNRSRITYSQPQDTIGQMTRDNEEVPDNDVSNDGMLSERPFLQYSTPRQNEKRLSCSL